jgi:hypothetical protein
VWLRFTYITPVPVTTYWGWQRRAPQGEGSLGLAFADYGDDKPAELEEVKKKGLAYAANPKLAAGMVLTDVQGKSVRNYAEGVAAIQARYSTTSTAAVTEILFISSSVLLIIDRDHPGGVPPADPALRQVGARAAAGGGGATRGVDPARPGESEGLVVESPWSQFTRGCQRFWHPPRLDN